METEDELKANKKPDIDLYKERGDTYKIIGNPLMVRAQASNRCYRNENVEVLEKTLDPIRIRLRVLPSSRVGFGTQGKTADYYFKEASKKSLAGELTFGLEYLKKGLLLNPDHL